MKTTKTTSEIMKVMAELASYTEMMDELSIQVESLKDEIKAYMGDEETMMAGTWRVTWKETISRRVDTTALRKVLGDALDEYTKNIVTRPFRIS